MDEGDRPGTDGDPAERRAASDDDGEERGPRDEPESDGPAHAGDPADPADSSDPTDPVDPSESTDSAEASDPTDPADTTGPIDASERDESTERHDFPGIEDREERAERGRGGSERNETESLLHRFRHDREGVLMWIREMLSSVAIVLVIGLILFGVSGVWPPMVAVESGSMEPNMEVGDLVFVTEPGRLAPDEADNDVGVVTYEDGRTVDYRTFGSYGSVVIYRPPGRTASPIIHRAMFHVEEGENWYDRADDEYHSATGCADLRHCPAPHDGFITLGDNNAAYDQANGLAAPVKAEWLTGVARVRVPYLGYVRLIASGQAELSDVVATTAAAEPGAVDERGTATESDAVGGRAAVGDPVVSGGGSIASASA
ncbi:S26 family signal peptidase [Halorubrum sp. Ea1]|uniref:S26 family signal peptidase n=1 Tax=Halorubrum sp. Ea1 TaxID=1480718 RepID=UPI000BC44627|nr:S26 family signal peptidase [Halorubrum sp. Ea1]OYR53139.1 S26 family signal peptidase [Halorubrum sp. Ea1]